MNNISRQFIHFLAVGIGATTCHYALLILLVEYFDITPIPASAAGALLGALVSYNLNRKLTFHSERKHSSAVPRFFLIAIIALFTNTGLMFLLSTLLAFPYLIAQIITTGLIIVLTFSANKFWTFKTEDET